MPNRLLRDWTDSERMDGISFQAEVLFVRLMMKADDYGSFHANTKLINSFCFPLKNLRETDISRWLHELVTAGLIALYDAGGKQYLNILNFGQRLRSMKKAFPKYDGDLTATCGDLRRTVSESPPEVEVEVEEEEEVAGKPPLSKEEIIKAKKSSFKEKIFPFLEFFGREMLNKFYEYWTEPNKSQTKLRWELEKTWDTELRLKKWQSNEDKFNRSSFTGNSLGTNQKGGTSTDRINALQNW